MTGLVINVLTKDMYFDPFSPPPLPQNAHEARFVGVVFFCTWSLTLLFLYWQANRAMKNEKDKESQPPGNQDENQQQD